MRYRLYFGCGSIRPDRSDKTLKWGDTPARGPSSSGSSLTSRLYPLLSGKRLDFERFAAICRLMATRELTEARAGLVRDRRARAEVDELQRDYGGTMLERYSA